MIATLYSFPAPNWFCQVTREKSYNLKFWLHLKYSSGKQFYKLSFTTAGEAHEFSRKLRLLYSKLTIPELLAIVKNDAASLESPTTTKTKKRKT